MGIIIAVANAKGGVGKTTTVSALSSVLAAGGARVLMVDLDLQANLTYSFLDMFSDSVRLPDRYLFDAISERRRLPVHRLSERLHIVPSGIQMTRVEKAMYNMSHREEIVRDLLKPVLDDYDFIFLDCPPALSLLTENALMVADRVMVPIMSDKLSYLGLKEIKTFIEQEVNTFRPQLRISEIFFNMYENRTRLSREWETLICEEFADTVMETRVRRDTKLREAVTACMSINEYAPDSPGAESYTRLARELFAKVSAQ